MTNTEAAETSRADAESRLANTGRNEPCPCGSGTKYKKCCLRADQEATRPEAVRPDPKILLTEGWRLIESRRPSAAEKKFRAALELDDTMTDAKVGLGFAKLSSGDTDGAKTALQDVLDGGADVFQTLEKEGVKDAFSRPDSQPYIRAGHALGCLAYDSDDYELCVATLGKVYAFDEGPLGTEARLVASKALIRQDKPQDALPLLEAASASDSATGRALMTLVLAHLKAGKDADAKAALDKALEGNKYLVSAILGRVRATVLNPAAVPPGSKEEAYVYAQAFDDVWDDASKDQVRDLAGLEA